MKAVRSSSFAYELILICKWTESSSSPAISHRSIIRSVHLKWIKIQWNSNSRFVALLFFSVHFWGKKTFKKQTNQRNRKMKKQTHTARVYPFFFVLIKKNWIKLLSHFLTSFRHANRLFKKMISMITHFLENDWMGVTWSGGREIWGTRPSRFACVSVCVCVAMADGVICRIIGCISIYSFV